jgi:hypothetical protein
LRTDPMVCLDVVLRAPRQAANGNGWVGGWVGEWVREWRIVRVVVRCERGWQAGRLVGPAAIAG